MDTFRDLVRQAFIDAVITAYGEDSKVYKYLERHWYDADFDEIINLDDLLNRIDAEINMAAEEVEYNIILDDDEEEGEDE